MSREPASRFGEPIELPWWVLPLGTLPILSGLAGLVIPAPLGARLVILLPSLGLLAAIVRVARRTASPSMQSVWISTAFGLWVIFPVAWAVLVFGPQ
jgi:hypothetical protein